jgi:hypothetical protein
MMHRRRPLLQEYPTKKIPNLKKICSLFLGGGEWIAKTDTPGSCLGLLDAADAMG